MDTSVGERRKLIFENYANGVDIPEIMLAFYMSRAEVEAAILFVAKKIKEYRFRRCVEGSQHAAPPIPCETMTDIRNNRRALLLTLEKLGPQYLSSELILPKITIQKVDHPAMLREATDRLRNS